MIFKRTNQKSKRNYYTILIVIETLLYIGLFFLDIHWIFLILIFPFYVLETVSNKRCLNRQKNFITTLETHDEFLECNHINGKKSIIPYNQLSYSFREIKFEKDKSEIEIKKKKWLGSKLIGRIHINNWDNIFDIIKEFQNKKITRVKFKPEGFWSKYGGLTADIVITSSALAIGEVAEIVGSADLASDARDIAFESEFHSQKKDQSVKNSS